MRHIAIKICQVGQLTGKVSRITSAEEVRQMSGIQPFEDPALAEAQHRKSKNRLTKQRKLCKSDVFLPSWPQQHSEESEDQELESEEPLTWEEWAKSREKPQKTVTQPPINDAVIDRTEGAEYLTYHQDLAKQRRERYNWKLSKLILKIAAKRDTGSQHNRLKIHLGQAAGHANNVRVDRLITHKTVLSLPLPRRKASVPSWRRSGAEWQTMREAISEVFEFYESIEFDETSSDYEDPPFFRVAS